MFLFFRYPHDNSRYREILAMGPVKMVRVNRGSSYRVFYEKVLAKVQGECKNSSSYWKFELSGDQVIGIILYTYIYIANLTLSGRESNILRTGCLLPNSACLNLRRISCTVADTIKYSCFKRNSLPSKNWKKDTWILP